MQGNLDSICIELKVEAVHMDEKVWMQGDFVIRINGEDPYNKDYIIEAEALLKSLKSNGEYFIFSCTCGMPECGGCKSGIKVNYLGNGIVEWIDQHHEKAWRFDKNKMESDIVTVREEVKIYKKYFKQKEIDYVGLGYNW